MNWLFIIGNVLAVVALVSLTWELARRRYEKKTDEARVKISERSRTRKSEFSERRAADA